MQISLSNFATWQKRQAKVSEAKNWLKHIGARGRESDVLSLSPAHGKPPHFTIAGQYTTGGQNYWESPADFDHAFKAVIHERFKELSALALAKLEKEADAALVDAAGEIELVQQAISVARNTQAAA